MKNKIWYNRIIFLILGICTVIVGCFIAKTVLLSNTESGSMKLTEYPEVVEEKKVNDLGKIPDSIVDLTEWVPIGSKRVQYYYQKGGFVYWSDADINKNDQYVPMIPEADASSFMIALGTEYAKDKNNVYWWMYDEDYIEYDEWPEGFPSPVSIIEGADAGTFRSLGSGFGCDKNKMYYLGEEIVWNDRYFDPNVTKVIANLSLLFWPDNPCDYMDDFKVTP